MSDMLVQLITRWPSVTGVLLRAGDGSFLCEICFVDYAKRSFWDKSVERAVKAAYTWAHFTYEGKYP